MQHRTKELDCVLAGIVVYGCDITEIPVSAWNSLHRNFCIWLPTGTGHRETIKNLQKFFMPETTFCFTLRLILRRAVKQDRRGRVYGGPADHRIVFSEG